MKGRNEICLVLVDITVGLEALVDMVVAPVVTEVALAAADLRWEAADTAWVGPAR